MSLSGVIWFADERWLMHGTSVEGAESIARNGFDINRAGDGTYGRGMYAGSLCALHMRDRYSTPFVSTASGYATEPTGCILLCRVAVGQALVGGTSCPAGFHSTVDRPVAEANQFCCFSDDQSKCVARSNSVLIS